MSWAVIIFGGISAVGWMIAAGATPDFSKSYYGGPPPRIVLRAKIGWIANAVGAASAALAMLCQAYLTWSALP